MFRDLTSARVVMRLGLRSAPRCARTYASKSEGYLHQTIIPTQKFQSSLPKLPIPDLKKSGDRFLAAAAPLVTPEELNDAKILMKKFIAGDGQKLQAALKLRDSARYSSFISDFWFDMYLRSRDSLLLNSNPQMTFKADGGPGPERNEQSQRAARMISSSVRFYRTLRDGMLEPDLFHMKPDKTETDWFKRMMTFVPDGIAFYAAAAFQAYALDMSQYQNLFQSTRIPQPKRDALRRYTSSRHVVVQRGSHFYTFDVLHADGTAVSPGQVLANVKWILKDTPPASSPVGVMTTMNRDTWAAARARLIATKENAESLRAVDTALFAVCLDDEAPATAEDKLRLMLHGNARNRWLDKSFQLIVDRQGLAAVNFEHAWGDGVAVLRYFNEVHKDVEKMPLASPASTPTVRRLTWDLDRELRETIDRAGDTADAAISKLDVRIVQSPVIGSDIIKANKLSPDGVLQMSLQLAYARMSGGRTAATYESASTSAFKHGRTETIRSATLDSVAFCRAFMDPTVSRDARLAALRKAVEAHSKLMREALTGQGFDRHLFALKELADKAGGHPLFASKAYTTLNRIILSTSTLQSPALEAGMFGPVNADCYGVGYQVRRDGCHFALSSYRKTGPESTTAFGSHIEGALREINEVLMGASKKSE